MTSLAERQRELAGALLDAGRAVPGGLAGPSGTRAADRFSVYRNNVAVALTEALRSTFPVVEQLVGSECFGALALPYALGSLPRSPVLLRYGDGFAGYLRGHEALSGLPYVASVADIEWQWIGSYYEEEAEPLPAQALQRLADETTAGRGLRLHPSLRWLTVQHSAYSIWRAHRDGLPQAALHVAGEAEHLLIARPEATVLTCAVPAGMVALLDALASGMSVLAASAAALAHDPDADLASLFSRLFQTGAITAIHEATPHAH